MGMQVSRSLPLFDTYSLFDYRPAKCIRAGPRASFLLAQPYEELFELPLEEVRRRLIIEPAPAIGARLKR